MLNKLVLAAIAILTGSLASNAGSFTSWEGGGIRAWNVDTDFRAESSPDYTYFSIGSWDWLDDKNTDFHAYFGIQSNLAGQAGNAIFSVFGPPGQIEGIKAADNGASGTENCVTDAAGGTADGKNVSCIVNGFPWKIGTWYTARIWAHGLRTETGIEQERWGFWILERDSQNKIVNERWVADFWVPRAWGYIPITNWGGFVETYNASGSIQYRCCHKQKVVGPCAQLSSAGAYYFAPPVPNQDASLALRPNAAAAALPSGCAPAAQITDFGGKKDVLLVTHGMLNQSVFDAGSAEFEDCASHNSTNKVSLPACQIPLGP
jgi:hypothetical protein